MEGCCVALANSGCCSMGVATSVAGDESILSGSKNTGATISLPARAAAVGLAAYAALANAWRAKSILGCKSAFSRATR